MELKSIWNGDEDVFRLRDLKNGLYQIHKKNGRAYEGTANAIVKISVTLGLPEYRIKEAMDKLFLNDHDYADLGQNGKLICTQYNQKAS